MLTDSKPGGLAVGGQVNLYPGPPKTKSDDIMKCSKCGKGVTRHIHCMMCGTAYAGLTEAHDCHGDTAYYTWWCESHQDHVKAQREVSSYVDD